MTNKEQDLAVLEKINELIDALPEDSYLRSTYQGFSTKASYNMNYSWRTSVQSEADLLNHYYEETKRLRDKLKIIRATTEDLFVKL